MQCLVTMLLGCLKEYGCLRSPAPRELSHTPDRYGVIHQGHLVALTCSCRGACILEFKQEATALFVASQFLTGTPSGGLGAIRHANSLVLSVTSGASMICPILRDGKRFWRQSGISVVGEFGIFSWQNFHTIEHQLDI